MFKKMGKITTTINNIKKTVLVFYENEKNGSLATVAFILLFALKISMSNCNLKIVFKSCLLVRVKYIFLIKIVEEKYLVVFIHFIL